MQCSALAGLCNRGPRNLGRRFALPQAGMFGAFSAGTGTRVRGHRKGIGRTTSTAHGSGHFKLPPHCNARTLKSTENTTHATPYHHLSFRIHHCSSVILPGKNPQSEIRSPQSGTPP